MQSKNNLRGFTIVELLIVVVVIAILAVISTVAYTGVTNRANRSSAMEAANSVKSSIATFQGVNNVYPTTKAQMVAGGGDPVAKLPCDITFVGSAPNAPSNPKTVMVVPHPSTGDITGFTITYWDYAPTGGGSPAIATMTVGNTSGGSGTALDNACS